MANKKSNNLFWNQLLLRSDAISDINAQAEDARAQILAQLASISEQFDRTFDPADAFEEYVAVALCQALERALTLPSTTVCKVSVRNPAGAVPTDNSGGQPKETAQQPEIKPLQAVKSAEKNSPVKKATKNGGSATSKHRGKAG